MSVISSIIVVALVILAVIFTVIFAIGHKFKADNPDYGRTMEKVGMIGAAVCVVLAVVISVA